MPIHPLPYISRILILSLFGITSLLFGQRPLAQSENSGAILGEATMSGDADVLTPSENPLPRRPKNVTLPEGMPDIWLNQRTYFKLFTPFITDNVAVSPDGKYIAYTRRISTTMHVCIVETALPEKIVNTFVIGNAATATPHLTRTTGTVSPQVYWMQWVDTAHLVLETNANSVIQSRNYTGSIIAIDINNPKKIIQVTAKDFTALEPAGRNNARRISSTSPRWFSQDSFDSFDNDYERAFNTPIGSRNGEGLGFNNNMNAPNYFVPPPRIIYLQPKVLSPVPGNPELLYISTNHDTMYYVFTFNIITGKVKMIAEKPALAEHNVMINRQGRPGIYVSNTTKSAFPFNYVYEKHAWLFGREKLNRMTDGILPRPDFTVSPNNFFASRSIPLGFGEDPSILYYASNVGRNTYGIYSMNLKNGQPDGLVVENPSIDLVVPSMDGFVQNNPLIFDPHTHALVGIRIDGKRPTTRWLNTRLQEAQDILESNMRGYAVDILDWDEAANHILLIASNVIDSGTYFYFNREINKILGFASRGFFTSPERMPVPFDFEFAHPDAPNSPLTGTLTIPKKARIIPLPVVVYCPPDPWLRPMDRYTSRRDINGRYASVRNINIESRFDEFSGAYSNYQSEIRALADMGFAVLQINARGTWGNGTHARLAAIEQGFDIVQTQDILAALDHLQSTFKIDLKRVAIYGKARGGYLALRAAQLHPDRFKCVVALSPIIDIFGWIATTRWTSGSPAPTLTRAYYSTAGKAKSSPLKKSPELIKSPTLVLSYPGYPGSQRTQEYLDSRLLISNLKRRGVPAELFPLSTNYAARLPQGYTSAFSKIEIFLNEYIYRYDIEMGNMQRIETEPPRIRKLDIQQHTTKAN